MTRELVATAHSSFVAQIQILLLPTVQRPQRKTFVWVENPKLIAKAIMPK